MSLHHADVSHKPLWPLDARDGAALTCALIALAVAAFGGVGGGGVLLPIYILVLDFRQKEAVALANATILGGAIANVWFASRKRHPYADRPLVAWDLILLFEPVVILGPSSALLPTSSCRTWFSRSYWPCSTPRSPTRP